MLEINSERDRRKIGWTIFSGVAKVKWENEWESLGWGEWAWPGGGSPRKGKWAVSRKWMGLSLTGDGEGGKEETKGNG